LLLDEVTDLPSSAQLRLLRLLEEREVQPVGYSRPLNVDVRIIAATNSDLRAAVRSGKFRQDLYFRLDVIGLRLPALRERPEEIPQFMARFNDDFAAIYRQPRLTIDRRARVMLERYEWPGNVRELRTVMERLHVLCGGAGDAIGVREVETFGQLRLPTPAAINAAANRFASLKVQTVEQTLACCRGNMSRAATELGVHRSTLYRWLADRRLSA
jgi:DNA-binding NtrC family response regulator